MRKLLTDETIAQNTKALKEQLSRYLVLDGEKGVLVDNADWLMPLNYIEFLRTIGSLFSVNRMLSAEAYKQRLEKGLSFIEFNYQILQAYDFLELYRRYGCTLQVGGDDQWGNMLAGVDLIRRCEQAESHALTLPLMVTATGAKMGKTAKGAVWLSADKLSPFDFYQYWINADDRDVERFLKMYTFLPADEIARLAALQGAEIREAKKVLAWQATSLCHGEAAANEAQAGAAAMVSGQGTEELPTLVVSEPMGLLAVICGAGFAKSNGEARRLVRGGAVKLSGEKMTDERHTVEPSALSEDSVLRIGKKRAVLLIAG
jgi:tyrosyl-tRNA synthetase